jgi:hypothetical protein
MRSLLLLSVLVSSQLLSMVMFRNIKIAISIIVIIIYHHHQLHQQHYHHHHNHHHPFSYVNEAMQRIWGHIPTNAKFDVSQHGNARAPLGSTMSRHRASGHEFTGTGVVDFSRWPSDW